MLDSEWKLRRNCRVLDLLVDKITYYFGLRSPASVARQWRKELISVAVQRRVRASRNIKISLQSNGLLLKRSVRFMVYSRLLCSIFRMLWARTTKRNGEIVISYDDDFIPRERDWRLFYVFSWDCQLWGLATAEIYSVDSHQWFSLWKPSHGMLIWWVDDKFFFYIINSFTRAPEKMTTIMRKPNQ